MQCRGPADARCWESETLKTYRSAVTAFTNWLVRVKDNYEVKTMVAKILKLSGVPPTYMLDYNELAKSLEGPANMYCQYTLSFQKAANLNKKSGIFYLLNFLIMNPSVIRGAGNSAVPCLKISQYHPI